MQFPVNGHAPFPLSLAEVDMSDTDIFVKQKFGQPLGFGRRTAVLVIDFQEGFTREDGFGGYNINDAIAQTAKLLAYAREQAMPVSHVYFAAQKGGFDIGTFGEKVPRLRELTEDAPDTQIVPSCRPVDGEYVSRKRHSSAFFGTNYASWLMAEGIDTLLVTGCTTSGCVRASVVDASAHGLRPVVVTDCVGDRAQAPHEQSLFDMGQKYADLMTSADVMAALAKDRQAALA